jgi:hypothetical protein
MSGRHARPTPADWCVAGVRPRGGVHASRRHPARAVVEASAFFPGEWRVKMPGAARDPWQTYRSFVLALDAALGTSGRRFVPRGWRRPLEWVRDGATVRVSVFLESAASWVFSWECERCRHETIEPASHCCPSGIGRLLP